MPLPAFVPAAALPTRRPPVPLTGSATTILARPARVSQARRARAPATTMTGATGAATVEEKGAGMRIIRGADAATIERLGCTSWPVWGCEPSKFDWSYDDDEVALVLAGDVTVIPDDGSESMTFAPGDIIFFPRGMSCKWDVREAVSKHYTFGIRI